MDASRVRENLRIETELQVLRAERRSRALRRVLALTAAVVVVAAYPGVATNLLDSIATGFLLTVIAVLSLILGLLPRRLAWTGVVSGLVIVVTGLTWSWQKSRSQVLSEILEIIGTWAGLIGMIWLIVVAALPLLRVATTWRVSRAKSRTGVAK